MINAWSEFQPLKQVMLGRAYPPETFDWHGNREQRETMRQIFEETEEDLQVLVGILESADVMVTRPDNIFTINGEDQVNLPWMQCGYPNHPLMPRDTLFPYGNTMFEMFTGSDNRYFENLAYYRENTTNWLIDGDWLSMPGVMVNTGQKYIDFEQDLKLIYHAANMIKLGDVVLCSQPYQRHDERGKGTNYGRAWIERITKRLYPNTKFINVRVGGHIDGKIALLKPGVLMTWNKEWIPDELKNWDIIEIDDTHDMPEDFLNTRKKRFHRDYVSKWLSHWIGYADESVFDVNVLSIDEKTVIVTGDDKKARTAIEKRGIDTVYWKWRHQYFWDGGIHCLTSDWVRDGNCESYL